MSKLRPYGFAVAFTLASGLLAVLVASALDLRLRDPDGIAGPAYVRLPGIVFAFFLADVVPRALRRAGGLHGFRSALAGVVRERWHRERTASVALGLACFYGSYLAYRNLKGALPFARDELHDASLLGLDRAMTFGVDPSSVLHTVLGTGVSAYVLSFVYLLFLAFVPVSLGVALVWARNLATGSWYITALCLNWMLGAASYYLVPSLGPVFVRPDLFSDLPETGVSALQRSLYETRLEVLADPQLAGAIQGVAGFASLHVSIVLTAALVAQRLGLHRWVRWALWVFVALTAVSTVYFGWHYLVDDVAGVAIAFFAVWLAGRVTGQPERRPAGELAPTYADAEPASRS